MNGNKIVFQKYFFFIVIIVGIFFVFRLFAIKPGEEFQVNTYTFGCQWFPVTAMDGKGNFVIVWESIGQDGSNDGVFAQRYNRKGKLVGSEFQVNTFTEMSQSNPAVAIDERGNFIIVWESIGQDGSIFGVFAQRYNRKGKPIGPEFQVNTYTYMNQNNPAVAMDEKGNFVIVWTSSGQDGSSNGVFAQRYNRKGKALGPEFQVNTYTENDQEEPVIAMDGSGNFVVAWTSWMQDNSDYGVFAQRYNRKGKALGPEFQVNTYTNNRQNMPAIGMGGKGHFVIVWTSIDQDGSDFGIFAQKYNRKGKPVGSEFQVNTYTEALQYWPAVAMDNKGNFVIAWTSSWQDGSVDGVFAQRYNRKGKPVGSEFQINSFIDDYQSSQAIGMDGRGDFVITWMSNLQDGSAYGVFAKMFRK